jgi:hypothetical protein
MQEENKAFWEEVERMRKVCEIWWKGVRQHVFTEDWKKEIDLLIPLCKGKFDVLYAMARDLEMEKGRTPRNCIGEVEFLYFLSAFALLQETTLVDVEWDDRLMAGRRVILRHTEAYLIESVRGYGERTLGETLWIPTGIVVSSCKE